MIRLTLIALTALLPYLHAQDTDDLLRFGNGDQLHGSFEGIAEGPSLIWKRKDLGETAKFGINNLRHLVIRGGNPAQPLKSVSLVELVNGDQIPGMITAFGDKEITIQTACAGTITIERNKVRRIAPQPLGGRLHYHGPFSPDGWDLTTYDGNQPGQQNPVQVQQLRQAIEFEGDIDGFAVLPQGEGGNQDNAKGPGWQHSGAAWYWKSDQLGTALILKDKMPSRSTLRFDLAWKSQLNMIIALNADFQTEKKDAADKQAQEVPVPQFIPHDSSSLPSIFGNAFILQIHSNYLVVYRTVVDVEGNKSVKRVTTSSNRLRIGENSTSTFEVRSDLQNSSFSLFVNGEYVTQWTDPALKDNGVKPLDGKSLAFLPQIANAQLKITDVIIAEWNGMPDSARSLQTEDQDVIVMTNGLDRLAGKALALEADQMLRFKGKHGEFLLPLEEIAELRLATRDLIKSEPVTGQHFKVRFSPMGSITGTPVSGDRKSMILHHALAGDITISNDAAVMFEFDNSNEIFTDWDANF